MSFPKIKDRDFSKKINKIYHKYEISAKKKSFKEICYPKSFELQKSQEFVSQYINPDTDYKSILLFHGIGSGKTCSAVRIGEEWRGIRKIVVVVPASLKGNFRNELRSECANNNYLTSNERKRLKTLHPSEKEYAEILAKSDERINKYYTIYSYNNFVTLAESGELDLRNSILIIDEVQNMISDIGKYYKVLYKTVHDAPANLRIVLLSATPMFDKPIEIALTMNVLRIPIEFPTGNEFYKMFTNVIKNKDGTITYSAKNMDIFKERIKGYVSYFRGAPPYVFPEKIIKYVKCDMNEFQYRAYLTVMKKEDTMNIFKRMKEKEKEKETYHMFKAGTIITLPNNFFIGTRIISNVAFPNKNIGKSGFDSFKNKYTKRELKTYSIKFYKILKKIKRANGPVFVYSNFKEYGGIRSLAKVLDDNGYKNYVQHGEGRKRYAIWSGDEKGSVREEIRNVYNMLQNKDGSQIKIILGSPAMSVGVSLYNVQQVHILDPTWNISKLDQIIGRGVRFCSHKALPTEHRVVKVYIYMATHPNEPETVDQYMANLALQKNKVIKEFETALKEVAVDCKLFKNTNVYKGEENFKCDV